MMSPNGKPNKKITSRFYKGFIHDPDKNLENSSFTSQTNPFNEIFILNGHSDIIKNLLLVDENKIISSSDDHQIILWDSTHGNILKKFQGHSSSVRCVLLFDENLMISGSLDKTLKLWNFKEGNCMETLAEHKNASFCLVKLNSKMFCSGGGRQISFWNLKGELLKKIKLQGEESKNRKI
jgi:WD40 repeat protein